MALPSLFVRLPNHLGDVCMSLPTLDLLAARGSALTLLGRPWAVELLAAAPWPVIGLPAGRRERLRALRAARRATASGRSDARARTDALLLTNSLSTALELRLAGMHPAGYATDARRWLLRPGLAVPRAWRGAMHTSDYYYQLALRLLALDPAPCPAPSLPLADAARGRAAAALARARARTPYIVLCPIARGQHRGRIKSWDGFGQLGDTLAAQGHETVVCPGPGELEPARLATPRARLIEPLDLGAFAALLAGSRLVVANDSGPGHLAASVGARLVGIFGVTDPAKTRPLGDRVRLVGGAGAWPAYEEVAGVVAAALAAG